MKRMKSPNPILIALILVLALLATSVAVAQSPIDSVIVLPVNEPVTVKCEGADELIATVWGNGEWTLECRQYLARTGVAAEE